MGEERDTLHRRREELQAMFGEGGPRLEAHLREQAVDSIEEAVLELDDAVRHLNDAVIDGQAQGMPVGEIRTMLDKLALDAQVFGPQSPARCVSISVTVLPQVAEQRLD